MCVCWGWVGKSVNYVQKIHKTDGAREVQTNSHEKQRVNKSQIETENLYSRGRLGPYERVNRPWEVGQRRGLFQKRHRMMPLLGQGLFGKYRAFGSDRN